MGDNRLNNGTFAPGHVPVTKGKSKITKEDLTKCLEEDQSYGCLRRIGRKLGVSHRTVSHACEAYGIPIPSFTKLSEEERLMSYNERVRNTKGLSPQTLRHLRDPRVELLKMSRLRARDRGLEFNLELSDIEIPEVCPVLGIPVYVNVGNRGFCNNSPTLDRIDNNRGYTWDNVIVVSGRANKLKNDATVQELQKVVDFYTISPAKKIHNPITHHRKRGERKLSVEQETHIKEMFIQDSSLKMCNVAKLYGVSPQVISLIIKGRPKRQKKSK